MANTRTILEYAQSPSGLRVDRDAGVIRGVKIIGLQSRNGHRYTHQALVDAKGRYEGVKVNIDHPDRSNPHAERKVSERFGKLMGVEAREDGLYGDLHYIKSHPLAPVVADAAESSTLGDAFGLSHNATVRESQQNGEVVFEAITAVRSVDLVADPATTRGIFESENVMDETLMTPEAPAEAAPVEAGEMTWQIFCEKAKELFDGEGTPQEKARKIADLAKQLLKVKDDLDAATNPAPAEEAPTEEPAETPAAESVDWETALAVLESAGVAPSRAKIKAVAALKDEGDRVALVDTWKQAAQPSRPRSQSVLESEKLKPVGVDWNDAKQVATFLRYGS